jgi:hypothetical protein
MSPQRDMQTVERITIAGEFIPSSLGNFLASVEILRSCAGIDRHCGSAAGFLAQAKLSGDPALLRPWFAQAQSLDNR